MARRYVSRDSTTNAAHLPKLTVDYFTSRPVCPNPSGIFVNSANVTDDPLEDTPTPLIPGANEFWTWGRSLVGQGDDFVTRASRASPAPMIATSARGRSPLCRGRPGR